MAYTYMAHTYPTYNYIIGGTQSRTGNSKQYGELGELEAVRGTGGTRSSTGNSKADGEFKAAGSSYIII